MALFGNNGAYYNQVIESTGPNYVSEEESKLMNLIIEKKFSNNALLSKSDADLVREYDY